MAYIDFEGGHKTPVVDWIDVNCLFKELEGEKDGR